MSGFKGSMQSQGSSGLDDAWELSQLQPTLRSSTVIRQALARERAMNSHLSTLHCLPVGKDSFV